MIARQSRFAISSTGSARTLSLSYSVGDLLVVHGIQRSGALSSLSGGGWTRLDGVTGFGDSSTFYKIAELDSVDAAIITATFVGVFSYAVQAMVFSGVDPLSPVVGSVVNIATNLTTLNTSALTTTGYFQYALILVNAVSLSTAAMGPSSTVDVTHDFVGTQSTLSTARAYSRTLDSAGVSTGAQVFTWATNKYASAMTLLLRPSDPLFPISVRGIMRRLRRTRV